MTLDPNALEKLTRDELIQHARELGAKRPELLTRPELRDEIIRLTVTETDEQRRARGWFGVARDLVASVVGQGLNLPDAAELIRGVHVFSPIPAPPVATVTLAEIYAAQGHLKRALDLLDEVLQKEPDHLAARHARERWAKAAAPPEAVVVPTTAASVSQELPSEPASLDESSFGEEPSAPIRDEIAAMATGTAMATDAADAVNPESYAATSIETDTVLEQAPVGLPVAGKADFDTGLFDVTPRVNADAASASATPFEVANNEPAPLEPAPLEPAPLEPAPLEPASLEPASLEPASLEPASLEPASLEPASLEPASLEPASLEPASLEPRLVDAARIQGDAASEDQQAAIARDISPRDLLLLFRMADGTCWCHWRLTPPSSQHVFTPVIRIVEIQASWDGPITSECTLNLERSTGSRQLSVTSLESELRLALGLIIDGNFSVLAVGAEFVLPGIGAPELRFAPPASMSEQAWRDAGRGAVAEVLRARQTIARE